MEISEGEEDDAEWRGSILESPVATSDISNETSPAPHKVIVHFDLDCFYAQVEMIRNPALRNVPLGIQQKYIVVTCNYVARERGLTKLMSVTDAKEKCPDLVLVKGEDLTHYREMSYKVTELLSSFCPLVERLGFDENFMDITELVGRRLQESITCSFAGHVFNNDFSEHKAQMYPSLAVGSQVAAELREAIHSKLGLTGCAGIATNKLLAKLVSSTFKPNQQTTLLPEDVNSFMDRLDSLRKVPGIGHQTAKKLQALGIASVRNLQLFPLENLVRELGESSARRLKGLSIGIDDSNVNPTGAPQSLSDEDSFKKIASINEVAEKIHELLTSLVDRMYKDGRLPQTFRLTIRRYSAANKWFSRESRQCPIPSHIAQKIVNGRCDDAVVQLNPLAKKLFHKMVDTNKAFHLTLVNVCFSSLQASASDNGKCSLMSFFTQRPSSTTKPFTLQDQRVSNSNGRKATMDGTNLLNLSTKQLSMEEPSDVTAGLQPMSCSFTEMGSPSSVDHSPLSKPEESSSKLEESSQDNQKSYLERSHLPHNVDPDVFRALPADIQRELLSFDLPTPSIHKSPESLRKSGKDSFKDGLLTTGNPIRPSASVSGKLKTEQCMLPGLFQGTFPGNVDPTVFAELPHDIQKEFMVEWRQNKPILKVPSSKKPTKSMTGKDSKVARKSSQSNSLLKYFKPQ